MVVQGRDLAGRVLEVPDADVTEGGQGSQGLGERADRLVPDRHGGAAVQDDDHLQPWFGGGGEPGDKCPRTGVVLDGGVDVEALVDA